ncbi:MAG: hypothetical protein P0Y59_17995 [Candidatus Sphingomonas phytovorans]|nr:hypothetical protein [Sphingomonas sp.]WEJ98815.1 MAG: hypothetical protein P0Y59_17995 [Sphingomonas sp.]
MRHVLGLATIVFAAVAIIAGIVFVRRRFGWGKRERRRARADLTGIVRSDRGE